jgi:glycosyltransferase involved in cell wall biosynthesis
MMVKDEAKNLRRCLDSLQLLLKRTDVELIVVDTGSADASVQIATEYTSKVYHHAWNNHFSEMRNITISYATGEWIFILDADEALLDEVQFIHLLNSPQLNKINTVQFTMYDYVKSTDINKYITYNSYRLFRNDKTFRYDGAVHNQAIFKQPVLIAPIVLRHYGYQFDNNELLERKFKRTSEILLQELEKDPNNIYYRYQLANSYYIHGDLKEALEEIRKSYSVLKEQPLQERGKHVYVYAEYGRECYANLQFQECIDICKEGIFLKPEYIDLYYYISNAYEASNNPESAMVYALKYQELMNSYNDLELTKDAAIVMMCSDLYSKEVIRKMVVNEYCKLEKYHLAAEHALMLEENQVKQDILIGIYFKSAQFEAIQKMYESIDVEDNKSREAFSNKIEFNKHSLPTEQQNQLTEAFASGEDDYSILNKIRISLQGELGKMLAHEFIKVTNFNEKNVYFADVFKEFLRDRREILLAFKKIKSYKLKHFIQYLLDHYSIEQQLLTYLQDESIRPTDYDSNRVYSCIANVMYLTEIENAKETKREIKAIYFDLFEKYVETSICRLSLIYRLDKMRLYYSTLDEAEDQFFILIYFAQEASNKASYQSAIKYLKESVDVYPFLAQAMGKFRDKVFETIISN